MLFSVLLGSLIGSLILRLALWPAFRLAGAPKGKNVRLITGCFLLAFSWVLGTSVWQLCLIYGSPYIGIRSANLNWAWISAGFLSFVVAGALCGLIASRTAPLPGVAVRTLVAGAAVGTLFTFPAMYGSSGRFTTPYVGLLLPIVWFIFPLWAVYHCALVQNRRLARFRKGHCVGCDYEKVGRHDRCTECGKPTRHLCHRCRHIVDARPGEPCPHCKKATIAANCWKCGYDWRGLDAPRCPECGVWKPVLLVKPAPNPPPPPASLY